MPTPAPAQSPTQARERTTAERLAAASIAAIAAALHLSQAEAAQLLAEMLQQPLTEILR